MNNIDITPYNQAFQEKSSEIKAGPVENESRSCNDIVCLVIFIALMLTFFIIGIYIFSTTTFYSSLTSNTNSSDEFQIDNPYLGGTIIGMFILSIFIAIIFVLLLKSFPACMVYGMIIFIFIVLLAVIILGFIVENYWLSIISVIIMLVLALFVCCFRDKIKMGILLLQVSAQFITQKPTVYIAPLYPFLMAIFFCIFWILSFSPIFHDKREAESKKEDVAKYDFFIFFYVFMFLFMSQFLYYVMTFFIATACANWYYGIEENYYTTSFVRMNRFHLGSITFGAMVITILTILRRMVQEQRNEQAGEGNIAVAVCLCLVACCLKCIEDIVRVLNHNSIIVMAVTGDSYCDSAKSALSLIFENLGLFFVADFISDLVVFFGILASSGLPIFIGILILGSDNVNATNNERAFGAAMILFLCLVVGVLIISMVGEALSCVFIFYCFDKKFRSLGIYVENTPETLQHLNEYESGVLAGSQEKMN